MGEQASEKRMLSFLKTINIMTLSILQAVSVILVLAVMILVLLSIRFLLSGNYGSDAECAMRLRSEIKEKRDVITGSSIFRELVEV